MGEKRLGKSFRSRWILNFKSSGALMAGAALYTQRLLIPLEFLRISKSLQLSHLARVTQYSIRSNAILKYT